MSEVAHGGADPGPGTTRPGTGPDLFSRTQHAPGHTGVRTAERLDRLPVSPWLIRLIAILFLGWLVESYDIGLIGNVLPSLSHIYHLGTGEKSFIATASTIGIVIGILPAGYLADRFGRKWVFIGGIVAYSSLTFITGFVDSPTAIAVLRLLAGLGMGAVFPLPYMLGSEFLPSSIRGRFTGLADSFLSVGYFLSPLLAIFLIPNVSSSGWRTMFFLGGIPILFAVLVWLWVPESPRWLEMKGRHEKAAQVMDRIEADVERTSGPLPPVGPLHLSEH